MTVVRYKFDRSCHFVSPYRVATLDAELMMDLEDCMVDYYFNEQFIFS